MSYVAYSGLKTPNEVLEKIEDYVTMMGYVIVQSCIDDLNIFQGDYVDGKRFVFKNRTNDYFIIMRSANGTQIFGTNDDSAMDIAPPETDENYTGIGMTVSEGYSGTQRWYNQLNVPKTFRGRDIHGVYMPIKVKDAAVWEVSVNYSVGKVVIYNNDFYKCTVSHTSSSISELSDYWEKLDIKDPANETMVTNAKGCSYTLYCNNVRTPTDSLVFTIVKEDDTYHQCVHLVYSDVYKYDFWDGGALFSGSSVKSLMGDDVNVFNHDITSDRFILPVLSSGTKSNTFLRIDIDEAPTQLRGGVLWASSGTDNITGKPMSLPIRTANGMNGVIPNYYPLQSHSRLDWGRNVNTLNCITLDLPMFVCVRIDPDQENIYACVGNISGIWCISTLNMQTAGVYERSYPKSNDLCQIFPHGKRRGKYGFDGISVKQQD